MFGSVRLVYIGENEYYTDATNIWNWQKGSSELRVVLPQGFQTDIASVPGLFGVSKLLGFERDGTHRRASVLHDFLYFVIKKHKGVIPPLYGRYQVKQGNAWVDLISEWTRKQADQMFLHFMLEDGTPPWKAHVMYRAVRTFGGVHMKLT